MFSVIYSRRENTFVDFVILTDDSFSEKSKAAFEKYFDGVPRCTIVFKSVGKIFDRAYQRVEFIKNSTYFRLLIPDMIGDEQCIYLDYDTIVCMDLQELYDIDLSGYYIGGVKAPGYHIKKNIDQYCRQAHLKDIKQYVNAGVLLMNLQRMREDGITGRFLKLVPLSMESQDQDIINSVCYGKIFHLPFRYNVMTAHANRSVEGYQGIFSYNEIKEAWNHPGIIHYAGQIKPWENMDCPLGDFWWDICRKSPAWDYFYKKKEDIFFYKAVYGHPGIRKNFSLKKPFVHFDLFYPRRLFLYGAGERARLVISYLLNHGIVPESIVVTSMDGNPESIEGIRVTELRNLKHQNREHSIIIATKEELQADIIGYILEYDFGDIIPLNDDWK